MHLYSTSTPSILRVRALSVLLLCALFLPAPAFSLDSEDSVLFKSGFTAYQKQDYTAAVQAMSSLLKNHPDTSLKDVALFWLAQAHYKAGHQEEGGRYMAQFLREYPESPLRGSVEPALSALAANFRGQPEKSAAAPPKEASAAASRPQAAAATVVPKEPSTARGAEVAQTISLEVDQFAAVAMQVPAAAIMAEAGKTFSIPVEIVNSGNGMDSFRLESAFPSEFSVHFAAETARDLPIKSTPPLAAGEKFRAVALGSIPSYNYDGQRSRHSIRAISAFSKEVSQSKEIDIFCVAPQLRVEVRRDKGKLAPGEKITYRISLLNIGTGTARGIAVKVTYPPQYELAGIPGAWKEEGKGSLILETPQLKTGESKDFTMAFTLNALALADQELFLAADVIERERGKRESFVSATTVVQRVEGITARSTATRMVVTPGEVVTIPVTVTNTGNTRTGFTVKSDVAGSTAHALCEDINRDGKRQSNEPLINHGGPLAPREEAYLVLEVATPATAGDGGVVPVKLLFEGDNGAGRSAALDLQLVYSRPIVELALAAKGGRLKPGEVSSVVIDCVNKGSALAREVVLQSVLPAQLELLTSEPGCVRTDNGALSWHFDQLGAGEKRSVVVTYKVRPGLAMGTNVQLKNLLSYEDRLGNRY